MVNFTVDELRAMMDYPANIRNMSVIAHVDHGKSTLSDSLIAAAGIIAKAAAGDTRFMQTREDEQARTITIKSSSVSLYFEMKNEDLDVFTGMSEDDDEEEEDAAKKKKAAPKKKAAAAEAKEDPAAGKKKAAKAKAAKPAAEEAAPAADAPAPAASKKKAAKAAAPAAEAAPAEAPAAGKKKAAKAKSAKPAAEPEAAPAPAEEAAAPAPAEEAAAPAAEVKAADAEEGEVVSQTRISVAASDQPKTDLYKPGYTPFLINLIDSPGHVDFSSEVTAALRVTDGALVVVDCIEGVCVQTETVLRQAIAERIKPVLFVNKLDRVMLELNMDVEEAYLNFVRAIESVNVVIATYRDRLLGDVQVYPEKGTVGFGSGLHAWGFTVLKFAKMYAAKFGISEKKMMQKLWGDNFFNRDTKKWTTKGNTNDGKKLTRGFTEFIMTPINTLFDAIMNDKKAIWEKMTVSLGVKLSKDELEQKGKALLKTVMRLWLPAQEALLSMIVNKLPSPVVAQRYRVENLYSGPLDDNVALAVRNCDSKADLMMYVSKMIPTSEKGRFYAFGRVFSGTIATGQTVRIQGPDFVQGKKTDLFVKKIQRTVLMMGRFVEHLQDCPCGNIVGLVGVDNFLLKSGTITTFSNAHNFHSMKYSVSPVVRVTVDVKNAADLPKLMEGLKRLSKSDPLVQCYTAPTGEHIVAGAGELHLEICIKDLRDDFMKGAPIVEGKPVVSFCETVQTESTMECISKSPNKHNRIYLTAEPLGDAVTKAIDEKEITMEQEAKIRSRTLADQFGWDITAARKIWAMGCPPDAICNVLVDNTKGVAYLTEIKDSMVGAFIQATAAGIYCEESMRGIRFNLNDIVLHADAIHRGAGQIMPPMKRAMYACQMKSTPALLEPMYVCDITVPQGAIAGVYSTLNQRRGIVEGRTDRLGTPLCQIKAFLPVLESFGFTQLLRQNTSGQAFPQMIFSHWQLVNGDIEQTGSQAHTIAMGVRERKGLKATLPAFGDYYDKL